MNAVLMYMYIAKYRDSIKYPSKMGNPHPLEEEEVSVSIEKKALKLKYQNEGLWLTNWFSNTHKKFGPSIEGHFILGLFN